MPNITFSAPPTVASFMKSQSFGRLIAGPVGSGKTTGCIFELLRRACEQRQAPDRLRHTRFAIVRQTLKQLKDTVLKDIMSWLEGMVTYKVSDSTIYIEIGDVRSTWMMIPLDDAEDQKRLLSMQLTGAFMSEAIEMNTDIIAPLAGRCGRYPGPSLGGCSWEGIIADTNFPSEGSDWHKFMEEPWANWQIFKQPGGLTDKAENLNYLLQTEHTLGLPVDHPERVAQGRKYYERLSQNQEEWVNRYVHAQYGNDPSGRAVFHKSFRHSFHVVPSLTPHPSSLLLVGQDFGRDPCSLLCQIDPKGRLLVLQEVIAEGIGLEQHIDRSLRPAIMQERYLTLPVAMVGDPAGKSKSSIYEETTFDVLKRKGFRAFPAPTNDIDPRIRAVEAWFAKQYDGGPAILIDKDRCPTLIRALGGNYRYAKTKAGQLKPLPDKTHPWSDIIDALQYVCLVAHGGMSEMVGRHMLKKRKSDRPRMTARAWT
jgi:hypothetical protein